MQESESLWSKDDLISEMEKMQAEIIDLKSQRKELNSEIQLLKSENRELLNQNEDLQTGNEELNQNINEKENLIQKISFEKLKLQSGIQDLTKELQIKSEAIVKMKGADLILKENEQLKEKDRKREIESNRRKEELEAEVRVVKDAYIESRDELEYYKKLQKKKVDEYNQKINEQDKLIDEYAEQKFKKQKIALDKIYKKKNSELSSAYTARNTALLSQLFSSILYGAIVTLLTAARSDTFIKDIMSFFKGFINILIKYTELTFKAGKAVAALCTRIDNPTVQNILYWMVTVLIIIILIGIPALILYFATKKYITWYKEEICDSISLWVAVIALALSIFLSDELKLLVPINLITANIIAHLTYSGIRAYIRGCKRNRGYY